MLEGEPDRIDRPVARGAEWILPVLFHPLPDRERPAIRADGAGRVKRRNVWRRRWRRLPEQHLEHPLAAEHRIGPRRDRCFHEDAALTEQTAPVRALKRHAAETRAGDAG